MTIGEIAKKTDLSESTLRYYEKKGLLRVGRDHNGRRDYEESDIAWIKFIRRLKETGMLLKEIRRYAQLRYRGETTMPEKHRKYILKQLKKWNEYLQNLDDKIAFYQESIREAELRR